MGGVQPHSGVQTHSGVRPLATAPEAQPHSVEVLLLVIAPEPEMFITHQEIPEITDLLNPHWEIFSVGFVPEAEARLEALTLRLHLVPLVLTLKKFLVAICCVLLFVMNKKKSEISYYPSIRNRVLCSGMLLYLHHRNSKLFFHPAKVDSFKDETISAFKTVSISQSKNLLD